MWVESDCNVPSGEALIRQVLYGLAFFRDEFGARPRTCWLPDVFGYPASLPGILKGCGLENFMTCKLHWQSRNPFPAHLFWWEGIDGSRVLAHIPRLKSYYNGRPTPEELRFAWEHYHQKAAYPEVLFPFGFGDGGGGPTPEMLEYAARAADCPGVPAARQGSEEAYFDDVRASAPELPLWVGELYLETHRGTYTTHAEIKRANRQNELLLREAEIMGLLAQAHGADLDLAALQPAWANLLLLQFHDILPGSSIGEVYREAAEDHARIAAAARGVRDQALQSLASRVGAPGDLIVFNSLSWARADAALAALPAGADASGPLELVAPDGSRTPGQVVVGSEGEARLLFAAEAAPAVGYAVFGIQHAAAAPAHSLAVSERSLENRFFALELDDEGAIRRLFDKRHGREVVSSDQPANDLQLFQDGPEREAAWNIHDTFERRAYDWEPGAQIEVIERGPVRAGVRVVKRYRQSRLEQDILLYDRVPRIDFVTRVDWRERQVLLKAAFPFDIHATNATFEIQFGAVERPTHRNTSWEQAKFEVAGHRWADLSEAGYGVSVLNDCKYGYDVHGSVLRLTLLRGTELPDPEADMGAHAFTYALLPHSGDWREGETVRRAWELNVPLVGLPATPGQGDLPGAASFIQVAGPAVLETVKPAENGDGWIVRLYEPHGGRGQVRVRMPRRLQSAVICNHVEEDETALLVEGDSFTFDLRSYQVRTFRVRME